MNKNLIEGLKSIQAGINLILENAEVVETTTEVAIAKPATAKVASKPATKVAETKTTAEVKYTAESLEGMTYNDIKKLAKELNISAIGNRKEIIARILNGETLSADEADEKVTPKETVKPKSKVIKKSEPVVEEPEEDEEAEDEEEVDEAEQQVMSAIEDMTDADLKALLKDSGISTKGNRQALTAKLIQAVKDGMIDFEGEEEDEDIYEEEPEEDEEAEDEEDNELGDIMNSMTNERKEAYIEFCKDTTKSFENGEITRDELIDFINDFNGTKDKMKKISDEDILDMYFSISANMIDDDGEIVEEGSYLVNEEPFCCGKPLKYVEDENKFICEVCGEEYEAE